MAKNTTKIRSKIYNVPLGVTGNCFRVLRRILLGLGGQNFFIDGNEVWIGPGMIVRISTCISYYWAPFMLDAVIQGRCLAEHVESSPGDNRYIHWDCFGGQVNKTGSCWLKQKRHLNGLYNCEFQEGRWHQVAPAKECDPGLGFLFFPPSMW